MASKKKLPAFMLEKMEEKTGKDLDHDDEKGESTAHKAKVAAAGTGKPYSKATQLSKGGQGSKKKALDIKVPSPRKAPPKK